MGHINLLMDENKCKINSTNRMKFFFNSCIVVEIWSRSCNIPKSTNKPLQVACSCKWTSYILADFY